MLKAYQQVRFGNKHNEMDLGVHLRRPADTHFLILVDASS